jgi:MFS family permease
MGGRRSPGSPGLCQTGPDACGRRRPGDVPVMIADTTQPPARRTGEPAVTAARNSVYVVFIAAGFAFASWASRIPQVRAQLGVTPGVLGLILLSAAIGSAVAIPLSGPVIARAGEARTAAVSAWLAAAGLAVVAVGYTHGVLPVAAGLFLFGFGSGAWDVAMNVQAATVEQELGRAIMPRFHAGWSIGTVAGAAAGTAMVALGVPVTAHLLAAAAATAVAVPAATRRFLPPATARPPAAGAPAGTAPGAERPAARRRHPLAAWAEPRTLLIGVLVLCMTIVEGSGNDWLSLGVIGRFHVAPVAGTATFALFLSAMTAGRWFGPRYVDRYGRVRVLQAGTVIALTGLLVVGFGGALPAVMAGAVLMGTGTALGFPVGMSAAADDPRYAPGRVSTVASLGYVAFLAGPPAIGFLADQVGVLHAVSAIAVLMVLAFVVSRATAPLRPADHRPADHRPADR